VIKEELLYLPGKIKEEEEELLDGTRARSLESLMEGHNWFLSQFVEIPRRSIVVCFLSLSAKAGLNLTLFEINSSCPTSQKKILHIFELESKRKCREIINNDICFFL
jgi:hypothetical protein